MAELRAVLLVRLLVGQLSLFLAWLWGAQAGWSFKLQQPENKVWVAVGQTLTLTCTVTELGPLGPVKWLKGWGNSNRTVYDQKGFSHRVTRAVNESNTDFTIHIEDIHPEDAGTYYCVKFYKKNLGDELFDHGRGTEVLVYETSPFPSMEVAAAVLCFILLIFILAFCLHRRKQREGEQSQHVAEVTTGSCLPFPLPCCVRNPGTPSSEVEDAENAKLPHQRSSEVDKDIHYADLQPLPAARRPSRSPGAERSEYASIRGAAK
ncbi:signal-regulatory protein delta-like isoform X1 [Meleagris gallopavo]|uniref:signal-regulatory protein delta-like isoform X1 n=1 Tax=Meleagris gallopavo TaxID=9103 RepID=UPI0001C9A89E|nr:signal-regulatory protein delta-like isoform X1 [Meleagris gallopavo]